MNRTMPQVVWYALSPAARAEITNIYGVYDSMRQRRADERARGIVRPA